MSDTPRVQAMMDDCDRDRRFTTVFDRGMASLALAKELERENIHLRTHLAAVVRVAKKHHSYRDGDVRRCPDCLIIAAAEAAAKGDI